MLMWSDQMGYCMDFIHSLERMNIFIKLFCNPIWLSASIGSDAAFFMISTS